MTECVIDATDGRPQRLRFVMTPRLGDDGTLRGFVGLVSRIAEVGTEDALHDLVTHTSDAVILLDPLGRPTYVNDGARRLVGVDASARLESLTDHPAVRALALAVRDQIPRSILATGGVEPRSWRGEIGVRNARGEAVTLDVDVVVRHDLDGVLRHVVASCRDVTATVRLQGQLAHQATHDALTGLPNRVLFVRKLGQAIERARSRAAMIAVLYVDIDRLKDINDTLGHENGDVLITSIGRRIVGATRPDDVVARIGGDEFVVLCEGIVDEQAAVDVADRIRIAVSGRIVLQGVEVSTGASVGVAVSRGEVEEPSIDAAALALMRNADTAMYHAKTRGRSRTEIYSDRMREAARERVAMSAALERALPNGETFLVYQPITSPYDRHLAGAEAFLRWNHPTLGVVTPATFLELAEESGVIGPLGAWVVEQACAQLREWIDRGSVDPRLAVHVNVSPRQLADPEFVERTLAAVEGRRLQPSNLVLEFAENTLERDGALRTLQSIRRLGVRLTIDDFGTGHSSLSSLRSCPADYLKLDGTFVRTLGDDDRDDPIVRSVIQLAHSLDMAVIAEWVSSDEQLGRLRQLGCDFVQGHHVGRPVAGDQFAVPASLG